jgi:hypothetical protein
LLTQLRTPEEESEERGKASITQNLNLIRGHLFFFSAIYQIKLTTPRKMRKPDPQPGAGLKKRASMPAAANVPTPSHDERLFSTTQNSHDRLPSTTQPPPTSTITVKRRKSQHHVVRDDDEIESEGTHADVEQ